MVSKLEGEPRGLKEGLLRRQEGLDGGVADLDVLLDSDSTLFHELLGCPVPVL